MESFSNDLFNYSALNGCLCDYHKTLTFAPNCKLGDDCFIFIGDYKIANREICKSAS